MLQVAVSPLIFPRASHHPLQQTPLSLTSASFGVADISSTSLGAPGIESSSFASRSTSVSLSLNPLPTTHYRQPHASHRLETRASAEETAEHLRRGMVHG
jgi:hypothetical protein